MQTSASSPRIVFLIIALAFMTGCQNNAIYKSESALTIPLSPKILAFPPDVLVSEGKLLSEAEPLVDETYMLKNIMSEVIMEYMFEEGVEYIPYGAKDLKDSHAGVVKQAGVISDAADLARKGKVSSRNRFYALGQGSLAALEEYGADYALFVEYSEISPSDGSVLMGLVAGGVPNSHITYRLALFDLRDGQLVWSSSEPDRLTPISGQQRIPPLKGASKEWVKRKMALKMVDFPL